jgi:hypothetical protein
MKFYSLHSYGVVYSVLSEEAFYMINVPRNVATPESQSFLQYYPSVWNGHVCSKMVDANCTISESIMLPSGEYRIRFSALKHFGNASNPADYDVYLTPPFSLVY